jgi:predicted small lipoprotein YifL
MRLRVGNASAARAARILFIAAWCAVAAGCGVRGNLEPPADAKAAGTARTPDAADAAGSSAAGPKPHRGFILDGLIR